ncbi:WASH complex subunit 2 isoform X1 [Synchiropus splendidus]|uniref:WASH complex subunit 2 isoform X1 n=1 Tax=Synchiropus splendidus TaxID=270530 RepID=UPI00237DBC4C|nr:WASH complex subunit 2 isoform X1 [Synchiropus splendidus]
MSRLPDGMPNGPSRNEHTGKDAQIWERPWTLEEMRQSSDNWSLAADAGLFLFLQDFSQRMLSKTHDIEKQLDSLIRDTKATDSCLQSVFNDFLMLSNTQFIENRVYDEEVEETVQKTDVADNKPEQKTREQKEAELIPKMQEAVSHGLRVLDSAFEHLDIKAGNSDSEDEEVTDRVEAILEPKDLYVDRPLPFLIGSRAFMDQDDVGLGDLSSDEMSVDSDRDSVIESEEGKDADRSDDDLSQEEDEVHHNIKKKSSLMSFEEDEEDEDSDIFGESDKEEDDTKNTGSSSFADELAARIKGEPVKKTEGDRASLTSKKKSKGRKESKSSKQEAVAVHDDDDSDDMFKPPKMEDEDFSPFGGTSGLFSGGRGLFDDDGDEEEGDLFSEAPKPTRHKEEKSSNGSVRSTSQTSESVKSVKKIPPGAVSIFPDNGLFGSGNDSDSLESKDNGSPSTKSFSTSKMTPSLPSTGGGGIAGGLFDDEEDDNDFFSGKSTKQSASSGNDKQRKTVDLFAEDDEDGDIFGEKNKAAALTKKAPVEEQVKPSEKKMPAGAISIFGPGTKSLISEGLKRRSTSASEESEKSQENGLAPGIAKPVKQETSGLFSDDDDSQIFPSVAKSHSKSESSSQRKGNKPPPSLFDDEDEEEDLFASAAKSKPKPQDKPSTTQSSKTVSSSLFSDDEDQWLSSSSSAVKQETKTAGMKSSVSAPSNLPSAKPYPKSSLFDEDDDDLFAPTKESSQSKPHRVALLFEDEDDEDQGTLFGIKPTAHSPAVPAKSSDLCTLPKSEVGKAPAPAPEEKTHEERNVATKKPESPDLSQDTSQSKKKPVGAVSLFGGIDILAKKKNQSPLDGDDDDDFLSKETPPADVKKEDKPKTNALSLFDNEEEDDSDWNDSIFKSSKPAARDIVKPAVERTTLRSTGVFQDEELLFSHTQQKDNDPEVDLFATSGKASNSKPSTVKPAAPSLFSDDDEDDLFAAVKPKSPPPVIAAKPTKPNASQESTAEKQTPASNSAKPKDPSSRIGKLQANLKIDPTMLRPGSAPTMPGPHSMDPNSSSGVSSSSLSPSPATTPIVAQDCGVNFDSPMPVATLHSAHKNRPKGAALRRPQSRAARQQAALRSMDDNEEFTGQSLNDSNPAASGSFSSLLVKDHVKQGISPVSVPTPEFPTTPTTSSSSSQPPVDEISPRPSLLTLPVSTHAGKQDSSKNNTNLLAAADDNDLFGVSEPSSTIRTAQHATHATTPASRTTVSKKDKEKSALPSIFDDNIDDLFQKVKPKAAAKETKASSFLEDEDDDDDLFGLSNSSTPSSTSSKEVKSSISFLKQDIFKDDVATVPKVQKKSKEKPIDSSLFDDNIDIFADLSEVIKPKPTSKTKGETKSIFDDDMDDIFSTSTKTPVAKAPPKSKKTSPSQETSTTVSSNIFDDPLNALGGE